MVNIYLDSADEELVRFVTELDKESDVQNWFYLIGLIDSDIRSQREFRRTFRRFLQSQFNDESVEVFWMSSGHLVLVFQVDVKDVEDVMGAWNRTLVKQFHIRAYDFNIYDLSTEGQALKDALDGVYHALKRVNPLGEFLSNEQSVVSGDADDEGSIFDISELLEMDHSAKNAERLQRKQPIALLVANDDTLRSDVKSLLEPLARVVTVRDTKNLMNVYKKEWPDLIFGSLDVMGNNPYEFVSELFRLDPDAYKILVSRGHDTKLIQKGLMAGAQGIIDLTRKIKPQTLERFFADYKQEQQQRSADT